MAKEFGNECLSILLRRCNGKCSDEELKGFLEYAKSFINETKENKDCILSTYNCIFCEDRGYFIKKRKVNEFENEYVYRCDCKSGEDFPGYPFDDGTYRKLDVVQNEMKKKKYVKQTPEYFGN